MYDGTLTGQLLVSSSAEVTLERADGGHQAVRADASGFFSLPAVEGPVRFAVEVEGAVQRTEWVVL